MSTQPVDAVVAEWGEKLFNGRGRKGRGVQLGPVASSARQTDVRGALRRTTSKVPEVMVKITGNGKAMDKIRQHVRYISRKGMLPLEDERGDTYLGPNAVQDALATWARGGIGIPERGGERRESFNIVLSMPIETDRPSVKRAAQAFAAETFGENHSYVMAAHDDTDKPHVHLIVKASGHDGRRLNPRKADLARWREDFASALRNEGIEANATRRAVRGVTKRPVHQAIVHMEQAAAAGTRSAPSRVLEQQQREVALEIESGTARENPAAAAITQTRRDVLTAYGRLARALSRGDNDDRRVALDVTGFVAQMPAVTETRHAERVGQLRVGPDNERRPASDADAEQEHEGLSR